MRGSLALLVVLACATLAPQATAAPPRFAAPFFSYASGFAARAAAIADVNGDGTPDVVIINASGLEVRLGTGGGVLGPPTSFPTGNSQGRLVVVGDLDGDGKLDVVTDSDSLHAGVLKGNGDGTFQAPVKYAVGLGPSGAALADLNEDGHLDLICASE